MHAFAFRVSAHVHVHGSCITMRAPCACHAREPSLVYPLPIAHVLRLQVRCRPCCKPRRCRHLRSHELCTSSARALHELCTSAAHAPHMRRTSAAHARYACAAHALHTCCACAAHALHMRCLYILQLINRELPPRGGGPGGPPGGPGLQLLLVTTPALRSLAESMLRSHPNLPKAQISAVA